MNFMLKALSCCLLAVIDWCCVILMEFCLAPLFDCYVVTIATFDGGTSQGGGNGDGLTRTMPRMRTVTADCNVVGRGTGSGIGSVLL
jgi:hypothetical protein